MSGIVFWIMVLALLAGLAVAALVFLRANAAGLSPREMLFKQRPEPRLGVIEYASVDSKRKLVLIRRDEVEHLIMTGGPVDVVIETGIGETRRGRGLLGSTGDGPQLSAPAFSRPARTQFGTSGAAAAREEDADLAMKR